MLRSNGSLLKKGMPSELYEYTQATQQFQLTEVPPRVEQLRDVRHHLHEIARVVDGRRPLDGRVLANDSAVREFVNEHSVLLRVAANTDNDGAGTGDDI